MSATASLYSDCSSTAFYTSRGVSEDVGRVAKVARDFIQYIARASVAYGPLNEIQNSIEEAAEVAADIDWDGEDGLPVARRTVEMAKRFASALPTDIKIPEVTAESRGELTFEWRAGKGRIVIASVYPNGTIGYSSLIGTSKAYGNESFISSVPSELIRRIAKVYT